MQNRPHTAIINTLFKVGLLGTLLCVFTLPIEASSLRCKGHLIRDGDSKLRVIKACGQPDIINPAPFSVFGNEVWMYDRGKNKFITSIRFRRGQVVQIKQESGHGL